MTTYVSNPLCDQKHFFELDELTDQQFADLDIGLFIYANLRRYVCLITAKTGPLSDAELEDLPGTFCDQGLAPLQKKKEQLLNATPLERRKGMLGTIKAIAKTRVVRAIWKGRNDVDFQYFMDDGEVAVLYDAEVATKANRKSSKKSAEGLLSEDSDQPYWHIFDTVQKNISSDPAKNLQFAAEEIMLAQENNSAYEMTTAQERLQAIRPHFTPGQFAVADLLVANDFSVSAQEIAEMLDCSVRKVYARLACVRRKMYGLCSEEAQNDPVIIDALKRKAHR